MSERYCTTCGTVAAPRTHTRGSIWIEIVLWCFFLLPGLIYSLWRLGGRQKVCRKCGATTLVPLDSPVAIKALANPPGQ